MAYNGINERRQNPLTEEQLKLISKETERAAAKALRSYTRNALIGFLILAAANVYVWSTGQSLNHDSREAIVGSGRVVAIEGCNRDFRTIKALRGVLTAAEAEAETSAKAGDISEARLIRVKAFYATQLKNLPLPDCKKSGELLTSDKDELPHVPNPLQPK